MGSQEAAHIRRWDVVLPNMNAYVWSRGQSHVDAVVDNQGHACSAAHLRIKATKQAKNVRNQCTSAQHKAAAVLSSDCPSRGSTRQSSYPAARG